MYFEQSRCYKSCFQLLIPVTFLSQLQIPSPYFTTIFMCDVSSPKLPCLPMKTLFKAPKVWGGHRWRWHIREVAKKGLCGRSAMRFLDKKLQAGDAMHPLALMCLFFCEGLSLSAKDHGTHRHPLHRAASTTSWAPLQACLFWALWMIFD